MTFTSAGSCLSAFEGGKPKPGTYKIQNIHNDAYLDIEVRSRELCCRAAQDLGEGRGLVRLSLACRMLFMSDN